jgi:hypothetical protein
MGNGTISTANMREKMCKVCGERFLSGALENREICLACERKVVEKAKADRLP